MAYATSPKPGAQVEDGLDYGGLYCCGGECVTWLREHAKKRGFQMKHFRKYTKTEYMKDPEYTWGAAKAATKKFVDEVLKDGKTTKKEKKCAVKREKKGGKRASKRARLQAVGSGAARQDQGDQVEVRERDNLVLFPLPRKGPIRFVESVL